MKLLFNPEELLGFWDNEEYDIEKALQSTKISYQPYNLNYFHNREDRNNRLIVTGNVSAEWRGAVVIPDEPANEWQSEEEYFNEMDSRYQ